MNYKSLLFLLLSINLYSQECHDFVNSGSNIQSDSFFAIGEIFVVNDYKKEIEEPRTLPLAYPNPTTGILNIKFIEDSDNDFIEIYDITGRNVRSIQFKKNSTIDMTDLALGVYFIKSKLNSFPTFKIIKK